MIQRINGKRWHTISKKIHERDNNNRESLLMIKERGLLKVCKYK